jgi:hypothetical protein
MSIAVMKQALEALEQINQLSIGENALALPGEIDGAMDNLRAAIEQAEKPVAWMYTSHWKGDERYITRYQYDLTTYKADKVWLLYTAPRQEQYDQTALELCEECGWKAIIPGDGCLVCARQKAKPTAWMYDFLSDNRDEVIRDWMTQDYADITRERGFNVRPLYTAPLAIAQKPVAYADSRIHGWPDCFVMEPDPPHTVPLYAAPRQWVELTDDEARALVNRATFGDRTNWQALVYMVDAKLKEKNAA